MKCLNLLLFLLFALPAFAGQINIEADSVELDEKKGTSSYIGNVKLSQDNLSISADRVDVLTLDQKLDKIIFLLSLFFFHQ